MLIKWIRCQVAPQDKQRFGSAQARWHELHGLPGFLGQVGGWNARNPLEACVVAFWEDELSYRHFMEHAHDAIFERTGQLHTYSSISVQLFHSACLNQDDRCQAFSEWLASAVSRFAVMTVSRGADEPLSWREEALLVASGRSDREPFETVHIWLDLAVASATPFEATSFLLEKTWLVL
jgi:hypothetical protein